MQNPTLKISGEVYKIGTPEKKSDKLTIRELVVKVPNERYPDNPNYISVKLMNKMAHAVSYSLGEFVEVAFDLKGREWNGKYYNDIVGTYITVISAEIPHESEYENDNNTPAEFNSPANGGDDLPF